MIIFIVGGARSGKSSFAEKLAKRNGRHLLYLATGEPKDKEMSDRIKKHRERRKDIWKVIEEPVNITKALSGIPSKIEVVLLDCITLWIGNLLSAGWDEAKIKREVKKILDILKRKRRKTIIVSNEVGGGIVPVTPMGRRYRDILGMVNQLIAKKADVVYGMYCGIPVKVKGK